MKAIANRLIVFAVSAIAFGTVAFGQTRMTAEIPFAFHTVRGTLPAGTYEVSDVSLAGVPHLVVLRNKASQQTAVAGNATFNAYRKADGKSSLVFSCVEHNCALTAIRTSGYSLEYRAPRISRNEEGKMAVISIPMKQVNAD